MLITAFIVVIYIKAINARVESSKQAAILTESANKSALMLSYMSELSEMTTLLQIVPSASKALDVAKEFSARIFNPRPGAFYMVEPDSMLSLKFSWGKVDEVFEPRLKASACWGISKGQPHFSRNSSAIKCDHTSPFDHTVCVPVISQNKLEGLLIIELLEDDEANESFLRSVDAFSGQLALSFHNLQLKSELQSLSMRDPLTDLYNRRFMEESFHKLIAQCARTPFDISVAILDIDFFKKVNDTFLHAGGDYVLSEFSKLLKDSVRANDVVCRYGGEEFVVIFNGLGTQGALDKANKFREAFNNLHISYMGNTISPLSVSIGVASFRVHGTTPDQVLKAADTALYLAKKAGRNCVKVASS
jgi:diguanylate cyclase (GGDEF)-like protein